ncbi:MAG: FHA domain-containing protein [Solirubrobacteraceae bacterium]
MFVAGTSQRQIASVLKAAYANGLLSQDTFLQRTDQLLGGGVIDPIRLVGDLNLRRTRTPLADAAAAIADLIGRIARPSEADALPTFNLLALDWTGVQNEMLIGRHRGCDVVLSDLSVSRRHARLVFRDGRWILQDLDSTNGTQVNGCRVGRYELRPGDHIAFGDKHLVID